MEFELLCFIFEKSVWWVTGACISFVLFLIYFKWIFSVKNCILKYLSHFENLEIKFSSVVYFWFLKHWSFFQWALLFWRTTNLTSSFCFCMPVTTHTHTHRIFKYIFFSLNYIIHKIFHFTIVSNDTKH